MQESEDRIICLLQSLLVCPMASSAPCYEQKM